jgi:hypothetical protein
MPNMPANEITAAALVMFDDNDMFLPACIIALNYLLGPQI